MQESFKNLITLHLIKISTTLSNFLSKSSLDKNFNNCKQDL